MSDHGAGRRPTHRPTTAERDDAALELARIRDRIDELDTRIVTLLNERADLGRQAGRAKALAGRRAIRDPEREREVLLRVSMANEGPTPQADLLAVYRRLFAVARGLEERDRTRAARAAKLGLSAEPRDD
jgi:chorismate mutase/prephenate dehydratase